MKILSTICSRVKRNDEGLLPAKLRYLGDHVPFSEKMAAQLSVPFYIMSGKLGLISGDEPIPDYDYYLEMDKAAELAPTIEGQIKAAGITEIDYYTKDGEKWKPYGLALQTAADACGVKLNTVILGPDIGYIAT